MHTDRPAPCFYATEQTLHLLLILGPLAADQWHTHDHQTPAQYRDPSECVLRKPSAAAQHAGADGQGLDKIEICPFDMVCDKDCALAGRQLISS